MNIHSFDDSLKQSHAAEDLPLWEEIYKKAFPTMVTMINHRADGQHQRNGIDRSVILENSKQILIDEKARWRNQITGQVYGDIALEYLSDSARGIEGWVCKPLLADYIAYAIIPLGKCYLLPVPQLQSAWKANEEFWFKKYQIISAKNYYQGRAWVTKSLCVPTNILFPAIGECLRIEFEPVNDESEVSL